MAAVYSWPSLAAGAALGGILTHELLFKRVYVDKQALEIGILFLASPFVTAHLLRTYTTAYSESALLLAFVLLASFLAGLVASTLVYRAFFHPLRRFPGPFAARLTKFYALSKAATTHLKWYQANAELHRKHGDYVRTGPRELSVRDPKAINAILGFTSKTFKGPFYDSMEDSVSTTRDRAFHKLRRKTWDTSIKQLLVQYTPTLEGFTDVLLARITRAAGKAVTINELAIHYSYDVMTQLAFGEAGGFVDGKASDHANSVLDGIQKGVDAIGLLNNVPWLMGLLTALAGLGGPMKEFNDWSNKALIKRKEVGSKEPDLMGRLLDNTPNDKRGNQLLFAESRVIIGAGSDTTATSLSENFIILADRPDYVEKIRAEIDPAIASGTFSCQVSYPILDSVINETMRLYPPVLFASQRETSAEGLQIGDTFIPPNTILSMPAYQLQRDPRSFVQPDEFIPERWTSRPELVINRLAHIPFLMGPGNCPGKPLAMMELRSVIARTLNKFDVSFPPGTKFDERAFFQGVKDHFVAGCPKQQLIFTPRNV